MSKDTIIALKNPGEILADPLTELRRCGARKLIADGVEVELQELLIRYAFFKDEQSHQ